jgi:phosphoadenosine phosphosulfate reductase
MRASACRSSNAITDDLDDIATAMESWSPADILQWGVDRHARVALATGFGVEGCVLIDMAATCGLPIDCFTLDTGLLFGETYALWRRLEDRYGLRIRPVTPEQTVEQQAEAHGEALWSRDPARCCALRKVAPLRRLLSSYDAWITAIRRDQTRTRAGGRHVEWDDANGLVKVNPLLRWSAGDVWAYIRARDIPTSPLYERGYASIGCWPCTTPVGAGEEPRAGRWRGHDRTECGLHTRPAEPVPLRRRGAGPRRPEAGEREAADGREEA